MNNIYEQAKDTIEKFSRVYEELSMNDRDVYDDLVVMENCDLETSGFETEEEKAEHIKACIEHLSHIKE